MNKTVVIYKSKYGSTKRYAEWIAKELDCGLLENRNITAEMLSEYDTIIYGGSVFAGMISGIGLLKKNYVTVKPKKIVIFTCGMLDYTDRKNIDAVRTGFNTTFNGKPLDDVKIFNLRGTLDYDKLKFFDRKIISMLAKSIAKKAISETTDDDRALSEVRKKPLNFTNISSIAPLVMYAREN